MAPTLGVTLDGYAVEGGYDVAGGPTTSFAAAQGLGRVTPSMRTPAVFDHLEELVGHAAALGVDELRLTMEWARLEPRPGRRDDSALARYVSVLEAARDAGLTTAVVLCDAAWPSWLGTEPWLSSWAPRQFAEHAALVAGRLDGLVRAIVTFRAPNEAARAGWRTGARPPFRSRARLDEVAAVDGMLVAHQRAATAIAQAAPGVTCAIVFEAGRDYDDECAWRDLRGGMTDPVLRAARRARYEVEVARPRRWASAARRRAATASRLRSTAGWGGAAPSEWWLSSGDPDLLVGAVRHADGQVRTVELRAGDDGWDAQLAAGLPAVAEALDPRGLVHLCGLVGSQGPLEQRPGLLDVDVHGGFSARDAGGRVAARLAALGR